MQFLELACRAASSTFPWLLSIEIKSILILKDRRVLNRSLLLNSPHSHIHEVELDVVLELIDLVEH